LVLFLLNLVKGSLQDELDHFFRLGDTFASRGVTKSAFSQARQKLRATAFVELLDHLVGAFYRLGHARRWQGLRVLAIDGSTLALPDEMALELHFGDVARERGERHPLARVAMIYDVLNRLPIAARIASMDDGELTTARPLLKALTPGDLLLGDRLYPGFLFCRQVLAQQAHFCLRVKTRFNLDVARFYAGDAPEQLITWAPSKDNRRELRALGLPTDPIPVRLLRVRLPNGRTEVLMTSLLDAATHPRAAFYPLYGLRWRIEEGFKMLKLRALTESFSGRSVLAVEQDFHAKILACALNAVLTLPANQHWEKAVQSDGSAPRQINFSQALSRFKDHVVCAFLGWVPFAELTEFLLKAAVRTTELLRPGRRCLRDYPKRRAPTQPYKPLR